MKKKEIKNTIKKNKLFFIGVIIGTVVITGIVIGFEIYKPEPEYTYFAMDDIGITGYSNDPFASSIKITYDSTRLSFGTSGAGTATPDRRGFIMRFSLENIPNNWKTCEISLYMYSTGISGGRTTARVYLFSGNWTEEDWDGYGNYMDDFEIYWKNNTYIYSISNSYVGFHKINITEYVNNIPTKNFSIAVYPRRTEYYNCGGYIYSSEWNATNPQFPYILPEDDSYKNYLPQLIWS